MAGVVAFPVVTDDLSNIVVSTDAADEVKNLFDHFDDPFTTGLVARFELFDTSLAGGVTEVLLFDQAGEGAPLTVQNFVNYVEDGDYANTIIHRAVSDFVVQGGGFTVNGVGTASNPADAVGVIPTDPPVQNEFSPDRSNLRGTIAMAKQGGNPNSATNQWFFNLADNSGPPPDLDNQNGGFTVFGEVLSDSDLAVIDAIGDVPTFDATGLLGQGAFTDVPLLLPNGINNLTGDENFVRYSSITVAQRTELQFSVSTNSNPQLVDASITDGQLVLDYLPGQVGTANITVQATNLLGEVIEDTFSVTVSDADLTGTDEDDEISGSDNDDTLIGQLGNDTLLGGAGSDNLNGGDGDDFLDGGAGNDLVDGGAGNNTMFGGSGEDALLGGAGNDVLGGGPDDDILISDGDFDAGNDQMRGGFGNDILIGRKGVDILDGAEGDDLLGAGFLGDTLTGGSGSDTFRYLIFRQSLLADGAPNTFDRITDLEIGIDQITSPTAVIAADVVQAGNAATLDEAGIQAVLSGDTMVVDTAATFTFDSRTFLVLNDGVTGYQQASDALIEITGFSGDLANLAIAALPNTPALPEIPTFPT
ncbi:MAG: peptidylprolyl isomerase [Cyanobacteria bacterium J06626_18]